MEIRKLNMLRGMAAMIVLVAHFSKETNWLSMNLGSGAGQLGVMVFFMLSGFLMSYLYMRQIFSRANVRHYIIARVARVLPLFLFVVVLSYLAQGTGAASIAYEIPDIASLVSHLIMLQGVSVLWTIGPEIQFYFLFIGIWALSVRWSGLLCFFVLLILAALFFLRFPNFNGEVFGVEATFSLFRCSPYFIVGVIMGRFYNSLKVPDYLRTNWFVLPLLFIPLLYPRVFFAVTGTAHGMWQDFGVLVVLSSVFFSTVFLVPQNNVLLANKLGDFLGKISYSLYLLHMPLLFQLKKYEINSLEVMFLVFVMACIVVSYVSYRLIELPSSRLLRKLR